VRTLIKHNLRLFLILLAGVFSELALSAERNPTFFADFGGGFYSYDSEFVASKDTGYSSSYSLGVNAGANKNLSMLISSGTIDTTFELNESKITLVFQDTIFRYFWGPVYIGGALSQTNATVTRDTETTIDLDAIGTGFGVNFGGHFPVGKSSELFLDAASVSTPTVKEVNKSEFTIGSRTDVSFGGRFGITRSFLDGIVEVTYRQFTLGLDGSNSSEVVMMTRFGLGTNFTF